MSNVIPSKITASNTKIRKFKLLSLIRLQWPTLQGIYAARHSDPPSHGSQIEQAGSNCGSEAVWISLLRFILSRAASIVFLHRLLSPSLSLSSRDLCPPRSLWMDRAGIRRVSTSITSTLVVEKIKIKWKGKNYCLQSLLLGFFIKLNLIFSNISHFFVSWFFEMFFFFFQKKMNLSEISVRKLNFCKEEKSFSERSLLYKDIENHFWVCKER